MTFRSVVLAMVAASAVAVVGCARGDRSRSGDSRAVGSGVAEGGAAAAAAPIAVSSAEPLRSRVVDSAAGSVGAVSRGLA
ncbi:MAG: hypothetical protein ABI442_15975, partial [Gemmatimonadaceae bacterium]